MFLSYCFRATPLRMLSSLLLYDDNINQTFCILSMTTSSCEIHTHIFLAKTIFSLVSYHKKKGRTQKFIQVEWTSFKKNILPLKKELKYIFRWITILACLDIWRKNKKNIVTEFIAKVLKYRILFKDILTFLELAYWDASYITLYFVVIRIRILKLHNFLKRRTYLV